MLKHELKAVLQPGSVVTKPVLNFTEFFEQQNKATNNKIWQTDSKGDLQQHQVIHT